MWDQCRLARCRHLPCVFQDGNVNVDSRCGVRVCQFTRHVRTQRQFNSTATGDENSAVANANGGGVRVDEDGTPVRKVNAGCGTPEQRREFVGRTTESVKLFLERTGGAANGGASQGKHARQVLKDISNEHGGAVMVSPEVLIKKARRTLKMPPVAPLVLPQMGRPRNLPVTVERAIVDHALAADDANAAYDVEALASVFSEFLGESVEGNDCLHKYKHCALSRKNIRAPAMQSWMKLARWTRPARTLIFTAISRTTTSSMRRQSSTSVWGTRTSSTTKASRCQSQ